MTTEQPSLIQGDPLVQHVDLLEELLEHRLNAYLTTGAAETPAHRDEQLQLLYEIGLIAGELRSLRDDDGVPF